MSVNDLMKSWVLPPEIANMVRKAMEYRFVPATEKALLQQNLELANRHQGERCFILGAGSSIKQQDIRRLKDEFVISVSNTFVHPDYSFIQPRYHVLPHIRYGHKHFYADETFVGWLRSMEAATQQAEMFFHIGDRSLIEDNGLFQNRIIHWVEYCSWNGDMGFPLDLARVPHIWSVSELAVTIAVYLGFEKIYLIGFDHDWFNGPLVYFYDHTKEHEMKPDEAEIKAAGVDAEFQMRRHADIFKKYKYIYAMKKNIFNANADPAHYLDVFPKVDYDSLFSELKA